MSGREHFLGKHVSSSVKVAIRYETVNRTNMTIPILSWSELSYLQHILDAPMWSITPRLTLSFLVSKFVSCGGVALINYYHS